MTTSSAQQPVVAIVVAAGSGIRQGDNSTASLRRVGGMPLIARSVRLLAAGGCASVVVVVDPGRGAEFAAALGNAPVPVSLVVGGAERQDAVRNGLLALADDGDLDACRVVLVHDPLRALVPREVVVRVIKAVQSGAAAVAPAIGLPDIVRQTNEIGSAVLDAASLRAVQTPQGFDRETLLSAHHLAAEHQPPVTDDLAVCEYAGHIATLVGGDRRGFAVVDDLDVLFAEALFRAG